LAAPPGDAKQMRLGRIFWHRARDCSIHQRKMSDALQRLRDYHAETAIILGSGLDSLVPEAEAAQKIPYAEFYRIPQSSAPGHIGRFVLGTIGKARVIFAQGRVHLYEGFSAREVTSIVRVLAEAGIKQLILTNAAGALIPKFKPGEWMMISDHINLTGTSPLVAPPRSESAGPARTFIDLTEAYSPRLRERFQRAASETKIVLHEGVYAGVVGPQYETPAEVRMLQKLGAEAVGMSTVLETIQARGLGLEVVGFSCLTNFAAGLAKEKLSHEGVLQIGKSAAKDFAELLKSGLA
jgi:purine-nucleoside phosphorylase